MKEATLPLQLIQDDPWLTPYAPDLAERQQRFTQAKENIEQEYGSLLQFAGAHQYLGINYDKTRKGWTYREWAPAAYEVYLTGDFNGWNRQSHPLTRNQNGIWEIFLPDADYQNSFVPGSLVKVHIVGANGALDRIPPYIFRAVQNPETYDFAGQVWAWAPFKWEDQNFSVSNITEPIIYECHVGMAQAREGVGTFQEFTQNILPRIHADGYNCIQLMAVMEHPYYGSFGYHVSNFFAASSRFGTPEDLKQLVNEAHKLGIAVIMDVVHSHSVKNVAEGLVNFDGSGHQYFHSGPQGYHPAWDSRVFDYGKKEVRQFLLSNVRFWLEEYHFDGFRFDGITSMLYQHHGEGVSFDHYDRYFKAGVDKDAITYLQLANALIQEIKPGAISIAEDMSGMPGLCRKIEEGGIGFDYRLGMGLPDYWIKTLKHLRDEDWNMHELWGVLTNRRYKEKTVAYAESHDQAMVGDKTIAFWLMDKEMYFHMRVDDPNLVIDRGIALHKMIRLITIAAGGEAYLNFIGNEFGHPEWIDFPRKGNDWSHKYARRQWNLVDNPDLKFKYLAAFDKAMIQTIKENHVLSALPPQPIHMDTTNNVLIFERNNLLFLFNFHPTASIFGYEFWVPTTGNYRVILNSDAAAFGGFDRIDETLIYPTKGEKEKARLQLYVTNRTCLVLQRVD